MNTIFYNLVTSVSCTVRSAVGSTCGPYTFAHSLRSLLVVMSLLSYLAQRSLMFFSILRLTGLTLLVDWPSLRYLNSYCTFSASARSAGIRR
ncbi:hypothetical protein DPMN_179423 [Dreissena polymorpha]|uniref:Uncharacterized protein n=1 Tax=Dreissena polymorpha TaxID=45954 RepID=A0A9D4ECR7_DREPO|nr:hypothetical protein DPMN_179423 [Dreissena polymorpha]